MPLGEVILFLQGHGTEPVLIVDDVAPSNTEVLWADTTDEGSSANTVRAGTVAPTAGDGNDGDFWINTATWYIYGPKSAGAWPAGVSMVGTGGGGGLDQATADGLYVNLTGDTMAGALTATEMYASMFDADGTIVDGDAVSCGGQGFFDGGVTVAVDPTNDNQLTRRSYVNGLLANKQPLDADLTAIAALAQASGSVIQSNGTAWIAATPAQQKTALAIAAGDVSGLGALATATVPISVAQGGSGRATATTAYGLLAAGTTATGAEQTVAPAASGFLKTTSTTALPAWAAIASTDVSGLGSLATKSTIVTGDITDATILNGDLATRPALTLMGNNSVGVAGVADLSVALVKTMLAIAAGDVSGLGALATASVPISVAQGGSGRATATTAYGLLAAGTTATGAQQTVTPAASGFLKTTNASALPAWAAIASTDVSGLGSLATLSAVGAAQITDGTVSNTELTTMPANTIKGNNTGATAAPIDMTVAQAKTLLGITVAGTAPSSPAVNDLWVDTT